jgi:hypothetical protein
MTDAERISREKFYGNLIWVIDGSGFHQNFGIYHKLPAPDSEIAKDLVWVKVRHSPNNPNYRLVDDANEAYFFRLSEAQQENPNITKAEVRSGRVHTIREIREQVDQSYEGHRQYNWMRPRKT